MAFSGLGLVLLGQLDNYTSTFSIIDAILGSLATTVSVFLPRFRADIESSIAIELINSAGQRKRYSGVGQSQGTSYWIGGDNLTDKYAESLKKAVEQAKNKIRAEKMSIVSWMSGNQIPDPLLPPNIAKSMKDRVALVVGNNNYEGNNVLKTPINDADDVSDNLSRLGFKVIKLIDGTQQQMERAIVEFGDKLKNADVGLFYYAGHGIQYQGENYLIPVNSSFNQAFELKYRTIPVSYLLDCMRNAKCKLNIVVLDACRDNPYLGNRSSGERGLAVVQNLPESSMLVYSTAPGSTATDGHFRNSPFASALIRNLQVPRQEIHRLFDSIGTEVASSTSGAQRPWISTDYYGVFYFSE